MKIIIAGGRNIDLVATYAAANLIFSYGWEVTEIVSGAARGADTFGAYWARQHGFTVKYFPVSSSDWDTYGKKAGHLRNAAMAEYADALVLVWDGKSKGSANMKKEAEKRGLKLIEVINSVQRDLRL